MQGPPQITEVRVKSVATEQRGFGSPGEFSLNPYRGCQFACSYCLDPETEVRNAGLRPHLLGDIQVGTTLLGFEEQVAPRRHRHYRHSTVEAVVWSKKPVYRIITKHAEVIATEDHLWLAGTRRPSWRTTAQLSLQNYLCHVPFPEALEETEPFQHGYISGMTLGDGTFRYVPGWHSDKLGYPQSYWRVALIEDAPLLRLQKYLSNLGISLPLRSFSNATATRKPLNKIESRSLSVLATIHTLLQTERHDYDFCRGFLSGFFDAEGYHQSGMIRIFQKDLSILQRVMSMMNRLGFEAQLETYSSGCPSLRLLGDASTRLRFLGIIHPTIATKVAQFDGQRMKFIPSKIQAIEPLGMRDVVDIQTSARTFFANNLATHNCYAKKFVFDDTNKRYNWGHWVEVKTNAADALLKDLPKLFDREIFVGSATDPYQPIEKRLGLTRQLLEILLLAHPKHVHIQTRSPHIVRDIDILRAFGSTLSVGISIPTDSEVVRRAFEPRAPSLARRIETGRMLREAGIKVSASVAPLLPCTPRRLAAKLAPAFEKVWVGRINFYGDEGGARAVYSERGWDKYLRASHEADVKAALKEAGLYHNNTG